MSFNSLFVVHFFHFFVQLFPFSSFEFNVQRNIQFSFALHFLLIILISFIEYSRNRSRFECFTLFLLFALIFYCKILVILQYWVLFLIDVEYLQGLTRYRKPNLLALFGLVIIQTRAFSSIFLLTVPISKIYLLIAEFVVAFLV